MHNLLQVGMCRPAQFAAFAALVAITLIASGLLPVARFCRERIEIVVRPETIEVNGLYVYRNPLPIPWTQGLRLPYPMSASQAAPAAALVTHVDPVSGADLEEIPLRWSGDSGYFSVSLPSAGETWVRVRFQQRCTSGAGVYLLTTTKPWRRPLEQAEYFLRPQGVNVLSSNYPLTAGDLSFRRKDFMPAEDWSFQWTSRPTPAGESTALLPQPR